MMVIERVQKDFPIARLNDRVDDVRLRMEQAGFGVCPVLNPEGVLIGAIEQLNGSMDPATRIENVMDPGPKTVRPSVSVDSALKLLTKAKADELLVTSSDGKLLGIFRRPEIAGWHDRPSQSAG